jgi:hypothetical protein
MRLHLFVLPMALCAAPLAAQQPGSAPAQPSVPSAEEIRIPPELSDPSLAGRLVDAMKVLSRAFLELPVGEAEAALEGRSPTQADRRRTTRSETRMSERELQQKLEESRPMMEASMKALVSALPAMMKGLAEAGKELEKATANMPRPDYPKR